MPASAMLDPGSDFTGVRADLLQSLGLRQITTTAVRGATGRGILPLYLCMIDFPGLETIPSHAVFGMDPGGEPHALVGRDLLRRWIVTFDGPKAKFEVRSP